MPHQLEDHPVFVLMTLAGQKGFADFCKARTALLSACAKSGKNHVVMNLSRLITRGAITLEEFIDYAHSWPIGSAGRLTLAIVLPRDVSSRDDIHFFHAAAQAADAPIDVRLFENDELEMAKNWLASWLVNLAGHRQSS